MEENIVQNQHIVETFKMEDGHLVCLAEAILDFFGIDSASPGTASCAMIVISIVVAVVVYWVSKGILFCFVGRIVKKTHSESDDYLLNRKVLIRGAFLPSIATLLAFGFAMNEVNWILSFYMKCVYLYATLCVGRFVLAFVSGVFEMFASKYPRARSLCSVKQLITYVIVALMCIVMISIVIDRNPEVLLAGLGASAALMSLVFKETIVSLVSGMQLSANKMLAPGDWVVVPKAGADGIVEDITLNTVKIRNWDNTLTMVPPTTLMQDAFVNWKGMKEGAGRRMVRAIIVDMGSVHFLTQKEEEEYSQWPQLSVFYQKRKMRGSGETPITNLTLYRQYVLNHLINCGLMVAPQTDANATIMVRYKEPTQYGMPVEAYCFTKTKVWEEYEENISDTIDFMLASLMLFGLRAYQREHSAKDNEDPMLKERLARVARAKYTPIAATVEAKQLNEADLS